MQFSRTTTKDGLIQACEFWTNLGDAVISGDTTLLKIFTARINAAFDKVTPLLIRFGTYLRWDDANNGTPPSATFSIVLGTNAYTLALDAASLEVLNIASLSILPSATATQYVPLEEMTLDDPDAPRVLSPNTLDTGVPTKWLKQGNGIYFDRIPSYSATNGAKATIERPPSYFVSTDTTKEPGFPSPFHELLALYASESWLLVNKPGNQELIASVLGEIAKQEKNLAAAIGGTSPGRTRMTPSITPYI